MTEQQTEFLRLHIVEQVKYKTISQLLNIPQTTLTTWYEELKNERTKIAEIRNLWTRKNIKLAFSEFYKWYLSNESKCCYCEITESEIKLLLEAGLLTTKRIDTRGRKLELELKQPDLPYDNIENLALSCYWCNNAKTDTFTDEEFKAVGNVFKSIWQSKSV